jgi:hypothetical protein
LWKKKEYSRLERSVFHHNEMTIHEVKEFLTHMGLQYDCDRLGHHQHATGNSMEEGRDGTTITACMNSHLSECGCGKPLLTRGATQIREVLRIVIFRATAPPAHMQDNYSLCDDFAILPFPGRTPDAMFRWHVLIRAPGNLFLKEFF